MARCGDKDCRGYKAFLVEGASSVDFTEIQKCDECGLLDSDERARQCFLQEVRLGNEYALRQLGELLGLND